MQNGSLIIEKIEAKNSFMALCYLPIKVYAEHKEMDQWKPIERLLMDSDQKQMVYVLENGEGWQYIRFPLEMWKQLDHIISSGQDLMLVTSTTASGEAYKSIILKGFEKEARDLVANMRFNANYGEELEQLVEEKFPETIKKLSL